MADKYKRIKIFNTNGHEFLSNIHELFVRIRLLTLRFHSGSILSVVEGLIRENSCLRFFKGQATIETAVVLITLATLTVGSIRIWNWFVVRQMAPRTQQYENSRVAAGTPESAGRYNPYHPAPLNILGPQADLNPVIIEPPPGPTGDDRYLQCLTDKGFYNLQSQMEAVSQDIEYLTNQMLPYINQSNALFEEADDARDPDGKCQTGQADYCNKWGRQIWRRYCCAQKAEDFEAEASKILRDDVKPFAEQIEAKKNELESVKNQTEQIKDECK